MGCSLPSAAHPNLHLFPAADLHLANSSLSSARTASRSLGWLQEPGREGGDRHNGRQNSLLIQELLICSNQEVNWFGESAGAKSLLLMFAQPLNCTTRQWGETEVGARQVWVEGEEELLTLTISMLQIPVCFKLVSLQIFT